MPMRHHRQSFWCQGIPGQRRSSYKCWMEHKHQRSCQDHQYCQNHHITPNWKWSWTVMGIINDQKNWQNTVNQIKMGGSSWKSNAHNSADTNRGQQPKLQPQGSGLDSTKSLKAAHKECKDAATHTRTIQAAASCHNILVDPGTTTAPPLCGPQGNKGTDYGNCSHPSNTTIAIWPQLAHFPWLHIHPTWCILCSVQLPHLQGDQWQHPLVGGNMDIPLAPHNMVSYFSVEQHHGNWWIGPNWTMSQPSLDTAWRWTYAWTEAEDSQLAAYSMASASPTASLPCISLTMWNHWQGPTNLKTGQTVWNSGIIIADNIREDKRNWPNACYNLPQNLYRVELQATTHNGSRCESSI